MGRVFVLCLLREKSVSSCSSYRSELAGSALVSGPLAKGKGPR